MTRSSAVADRHDGYSRACIASRSKKNVRASRPKSNLGNYRLQLPKLPFGQFCTYKLHKSVSVFLRRKYPTSHMRRGSQKRIYRLEIYVRYSQCSYLSVICYIITFMLRSLTAIDNQLCCRKEAARCFVSVSSYSFNGAKRRAQCVIVSYIGYRFITAYSA